MLPFGTLISPARKSTLSKLLISLRGRKYYTTSRTVQLTILRALNGNIPRYLNMPKKIKTTIKLQIEGGKATPAPPVGTALGPHGLNISDFVRQFNDATKDKVGEVVPLEITVYEDRTFSFIMKTPPAAFLLRKAAGIEKGSGEPNKNKVGKVTKAQVREIAQTKMTDLNANDLDAATKIIEGTARSMGIEMK